MVQVIDTRGDKLVHASFPTFSLQCPYKNNAENYILELGKSGSAVFENMFFKQFDTFLFFQCNFPSCREVIFLEHTDVVFQSYDLQ